MNAKVNWVGIEEIGETRILDALKLAMLGKTIPEISRETKLPTSSLYSIRLHGAFAHRKNKIKTNGK